MIVSPTGSGSITSPDFETNPTEYPSYYTCSDTYTITAQPDTTAGYEFVHWNVVSAVANVTETVNPLPVSILDGYAKTVTAYFKVEGAQNQPPTADAGEDQTVYEDYLVELDGSGSFDLDSGIKSYAWEQTEGTPVTLSNAFVVKPTFQPPALFDDPVTLTFQLTVEDNAGATATDTVSILVLDSGNEVPTADAGEDQIVTEGHQVTLDGSGSSDPDDGIKSYTWELTTEGIDVTLSDAAAVSPTFTAPEVYEDPVTLVFRLTVEDVAGATSADLVDIKVKSGPIGGSGGGGCFISDAVR